MTSDLIEVELFGATYWVRVTGYEKAEPEDADSPGAPELVEWEWVVPPIATTDVEVDAVHDEVVDELHKQQRRERAEAELAAGERRGVA